MNSWAYFQVYDERNLPIYTFGVISFVFKNIHYPLIWTSYLYVLSRIYYDPVLINKFPSIEEFSICDP